MFLGSSIHREVSHSTPPPSKPEVDRKIFYSSPSLTARFYKSKYVRQYFSINLLDVGKILYWNLARYARYVHMCSRMIITKSRIDSSDYSEQVPKKTLFPTCIHYFFLQTDTTSSYIYTLLLPTNRHYFFLQIHTTSSYKYTLLLPTNRHYFFLHIHTTSSYKYTLLLPTNTHYFFLQTYTTSSYKYTLLLPTNRHYFFLQISPEPCRVEYIWIYKTNMYVYSAEKT